MSLNENDLMKESVGCFSLIKVRSKIGI